MHNAGWFHEAFGYSLTSLEVNRAESKTRPPRGVRTHTHTHTSQKLSFTINYTVKQTYAYLHNYIKMKHAHTLTSG